MDPSLYRIAFDYHAKLQMSVEHLATGSGTMKARLKNVMVSHVLSLGVDRDASDVDALIADAIALATSRRDKTGIAGDLHVTLAQSGWQTDRKIAGKIFQAYELASAIRFGLENIPRRDGGG